jgi:hypothetical protein
MRFLAAILVSLCLLGCGGGGGSDLPSPYAGAWAGVVGVADGGAGGSGGEPSSVVLTVDGKGRVSGTWSDSLGSGSLTGKVEAGGRATLTIAMGSEAATGQGVTVIAQDGHWTGSLQVVDQPGVSLAFDVARQ